MEITAEEFRRKLAANEDYLAGIKVKEGEVLDSINLRELNLRGAILRKAIPSVSFA